MIRIPIFQVDAFAKAVFSGNPAAVCFLDEWLPDTVLQSIAAENNLAETAFVFRKGLQFEIRWFTPVVEVDLCGHATLASGFVLFDLLGHKGSEIVFQSPRSGLLKVLKQEGKFFLDFPADILLACDAVQEIEACLGCKPLAVYKGKADYLAVVGNEKVLRNIDPVYDEIEKLAARGLIVTARGDEVDFVSRFFAPQSGILEDSVTGSSHTSLVPYWGSELGKTFLSARQLSVRGGSLECYNRGDRVLIGGEAKLFLRGEIEL